MIVSGKNDQFVGNNGMMNQWMACGTNQFVRVGSATFIEIHRVSLDEEMTPISASPTKITPNLSFLSVHHPSTWGFS